MIRMATGADLDQVARIYDEVLDHEAVTMSYTNWQKGKYPCRATAENALKFGWLYVMEEGDEVVAPPFSTGNSCPSTAPCPGPSRRKPSGCLLSTPCVSHPPSPGGAMPGPL